MEDVRKTTVHTQNPVKTERNSRCVLLHYFQGDIGSVVDEHFSRALSNVKSPQGQHPSIPSREVLLRNGSGMSLHQRRFCVPWTKPQPQVSFANGAASCSLNGSGLIPMDQYPLSLTGGPSVQPGELWHFTPLASSGFPEAGYPHAFSTGHFVPEPQPEGRYEPLLSLLQPERCLTHPQESALWEDGNSAQMAGSTGLFFNLPPSSAHFKRIYFPPDGGPAGASFAVERSQSSERRRQWHSTPVLLPGQSHGRRGLVGYSPWGRTESDTTEPLHFHVSLSCTGEGNGNPLQCSCLEKPRDGGAW